MSTIPPLFVFSVGSAFIAVICFVVFRKVPKRVCEEEDQKFLDAMLSIVGTLVSIVIGLLVAFALDHYSQIEQSVDAEAANVSMIYRLTAGLDDFNRAKIRQLCNDYDRDMVNNEWPAMERGKLSDTAFPIYAKLMSSIASYLPQNNGQNNVHAALITACEELGNGRRMRILVLNSTWIGHVMPVLLMCALIVLIFAFSYIRKGEAFHGFLLALVALALGGNLGLVYLLSQPFAGEWKIHPRGFELNQQIIQNIKSTPELKSILKEDSH